MRPLTDRPYSVSVEISELLPFRVRLAENSKDVSGAVEIRSQAFGRHIPAFGEALRNPEADDFRPDVLLLIAERKADGKVIGSMRLQPNTFRPLRIEQAALLPEPYRGRRLVEFMRLGIENGNQGRMVMAALAKASYEICHAAEFDFVLAAGRRSTAEIYRAMQFDDVFEGGTVVLSYALGMRHGVFALPVQDADRRWKLARHSLYRFMACTEHPDIHVDYGQVALAFGHTG